MTFSAMDTYSSTIYGWYVIGAAPAQALWNFGKKVWGQNYGNFTLALINHTECIPRPSVDTKEASLHRPLHHPEKDSDECPVRRSLNVCFFDGLDMFQVLFAHFWPEDGLIEKCLWSGRSPWITAKVCEPKDKDNDCGTEQNQAPGLHARGRNCYGGDISLCRGPAALCPFKMATPNF